MRGEVKLMLMALIAVSCSGEGLIPGSGIDYQYGRQLSHEKIVLGERLENPYKTENITKALESLYPTKADRVDVKTTDLYVRFLPKSDSEYETLESLDIILTDHPLDYEIVEEGDWYHDPEVPEGDVTWQYAVVPPDFPFPDIEYEIIDECFISTGQAGTRADDGIDWDAVERQAYVLTGNERFLAPQTKAAKVCPAGRITIVDEHFNDAKPIGVSGVRVSCNSFVKFSHSYTDEQGYYQMDKKFSADLRYRLVFENKCGFSIGFNLLLVPASVSTLGKSGPEGVNMTVTSSSESKLFKRCVVNNAAYDYYKRCDSEDLDLVRPPKDLRIWMFHRMDASSAVMLHHGAVLDNSMVSAFLGDFAPLIKIFLPDITLGVESRKDYRSVYSTACHELAHASHFAQAGTGYWNTFIMYIIGSYISTGGMTYGDGKGTNAGYCEIGEMWAYYLESKIFHERYGGSYPTFGTSYWFYPQIFRDLETAGLSCGEMFSVLNNKVTSLDELERVLLAEYTVMDEQIERVFDKYR